MSLIEMSVTAGIMILAVVIVRALTIHRLPKKTFLALWAVVLCRLLLPVALPSPLSFYNAVPAPRGGGLPAAGWLPVLPGAAGGESAAAGAPISWLPALWLLGAAAAAAFFLIAYVRCRGAFREALPVENEFARQWLEEHPLRRAVRLRQSERISAPLTYGLLRPVLLMPKTTDWGDESRLQYVLSHELCHIRRLDTLWKLILTAAVCLHWFNPLVWAMYVLANRDLELSCDESVVRAFGEEARKAYALTLIGMEERRSMLTPLCNNFSKTAIEERIRALMGQKRVTAVAVLAALVIVAGVTVVFATSAPGSTNPAATPEPSQAADPATSPQPVSDAPFVARAEGYTAAVEGARGALDGSGWNEAGEYVRKPDPETGHYYTRKQYDLVAAFRTEGYENLSIAAFNRAVNQAFQTEGDYEGSFAEAYGELSQDLPLDDPLASFVYYTIDASANEYNTRLSEVYSGKRVDPAFESEASRTETANVFGDEVEVGWARVGCSVSYRILDQDRLTVGERDKFLLDIVRGMQAWLDGLDLRSQTDEESVRKAAQAELERLGKAGTTARIEYTGGTVEDCYWDFYRD